nr:MAG TPA: hypothetical protein [Caudoviricetes sp.]
MAFGNKQNRDIHGRRRYKSRARFVLGKQRLLHSAGMP